MPGNGSLPTDRKILEVVISSFQTGSQEWGARAQAHILRGKMVEFNWYMAYGNTQLVRKERLK